ncbi:MAG: FAD:protein FMN transferase [Planctomycetaceae bacterium]|nr:FAD:protein FMN transferase [Planctomycetaceae bacterium]
MGTTYSITIIDPPEGEDPEALSAGIFEVLKNVNQQMSNWIEDSEVSRFNASESTDWFEVSPETAKVLQESIRIHQLSGGAFDVTVAPLIDAWGFGPAGRDKEPPTEDELNELAKLIGSEKITTRLEPPGLKKSVTGLSVNLSAIAKGFGVDAVSEYLGSRGVKSYLVEIGGEVRVAGRKENGARWRIGIERPESSRRTLQTSVALDDQAMATSGDYRNYIERDGQKYSHTIDPRTLKPITHTLASVSVVAETCLEADALATALMVMGPDNGYNWAEAQNLAALMLIHADEGFEERATSVWKQGRGEKQ